MFTLYFNFREQSKGAILERFGKKEKEIINFGFFSSRKEWVKSKIITY